MTIDIAETKVARNESRLWLEWTLATTAGMLFGHLLAALIAPIFDLGIARLLLPLLTGILVGVGQWLVIRAYLANSADWILTGGLAFAASYALGLVLIQALAGSIWAAVLGYLLFGAIIGLVQWPVLRREIPNAFPWVLGNIVGWGLGAYLGQLAIGTLYADSPAEPLVSTAVISTITGLVAGAVTGFIFVRIVRRPDQPMPEAAAEEVPVSEPANPQELG
jgi:hypothetical protein